MGEAATTEITKTQDAQGFDENRTAARKGGRIAGDARKELETETKKKVSTSENYLAISQKEKKRFPKK
jgi:DNA-damage-inducible protein D